jgi:hypothetical protein
MLKKWITDRSPLITIDHPLVALRWRLTDEEALRRQISAWIGDRSDRSVIHFFSIDHRLTHLRSLT